MSPEFILLAGIVSALVVLTLFGLRSDRGKRNRRLGPVRPDERDRTLVFRRIMGQGR